MPEESYSVKRRSERTPLQIPVLLVTASETVAHRGMTVDVSPEGMRLESDTPLVPQQLVRLHVAASPTDYVKARVVWVGNTDSAGARQAGLEFLISPTKLVH